MRIAVLLASLVAALALVAGGCGGSDESSEASATVDWADEFCTAVSSWTESLKEIGAQFTDLSNLSQDSLEEAVNDARKATDDMVNEIKSLGTPDTESGQEAKQAVDNLATELDGGVAEVEQTVEGIQGITGIPSAISTLTTTLTSMSQAVTTTTSTLTSGDAGDELKSAFEQAPACDDLTSSSS